MLCMVAMKVAEQAWKTKKKKMVKIAVALSVKVNKLLCKNDSSLNEMLSLMVGPYWFSVLEYCQDRMVMAVCINIIQVIPMKIKWRLHILSMMKLPTMVKIKLFCYVSAGLANNIEG